MQNQLFDSLQRFHRQRQRGAAMLFAIAFIVVASLLGAAMVRMLRVEQVGVATDVLSTRALLAADSAAQRALNQLFVGSISCANLSLPANTPGFGNVSGLNNCTVAVACTPYTTPASANTYYSIITTGSCGPANDPATRRVEVLARDI